MGCTSSKQRSAQEAVLRKWVKSNVSATDYDGDSFVDLLTLSLQRSSAFQSWSIGHIRSLASSAMEREFFDMEPIFKEGEDSDSIFFVKSGKVELTSLVQGSLDMVSKGGVFGEKDLASRQKRTHNAFARGKSTVLMRISRAEYHQIMMNRNAVTELPTYNTLLDCVILFGLLEPQIITLHSHCELEHFNPNETIVNRGEPCPDKLYIVHKGSVTVSQIASDYGLNSLWKLEWVGLNTYVVINKTGYFGDSSSDPSGVESNIDSGSDVNNGGNVGSTVTVTAGPKGADCLSISRRLLTTKGELRPVLERIVLNIQGRDADLRRDFKSRPLDQWLCKVGRA